VRKYILQVRKEQIDMTKILKKIKKKISNNGSSLILVIVALGFVGILMGALLTAVGYAYRQKLYDYNAKSNFYYLEQAMDEIYAGVGSDTMTYMTEAYDYTRENAIEYNLKTHDYDNIGNDNANKIFKDEFMKKVGNSSSYSIKFKSGKIDDNDGLIGKLKSFISNSSVKLVYDDISVSYYFKDGTVSSTPGASTSDLNKICIKNVTVSRTVPYKRSTASGDFTQTISTDIEICRPDFDVNFEGTSSDLNNLFSFCIISDSGVEVNQNLGNILSIKGNVYAANDFYNKKYNQYSSPAALDDNGKIKRNSNGNIIVDSHYTDPVSRKSADGVETKYVMNKVSKYTYEPSSGATTLYNRNAVQNDLNAIAVNKYDGFNVRSKYSGFYVNGSSVNIIAEKIIVPGTIAVMDSGSLSVFGVSDNKVTQAEVWTDEIILDGATKGNPVKNGDSVTTSIKNEVGSKADFTANLYVKDDTQIESDYSSFRLNGSYYGYGNSTDADSRSFIPTTLISNSANGRNIYQQDLIDDNGLVVSDRNAVRAHYNSSAIIVNGKNDIIDLCDAQSIYIAGRSYIELSKVKTSSPKNKYIHVKDTEYDENGKPIANSELDKKETTNTITYSDDVQDYKTGESLSIKSSQLAYKPAAAPEKETNTINGTKVEEYFSLLPESLTNITLFKKYFNTAVSSGSSKQGKVPVVYVKEGYYKTLDMYTDSTTATKIKNDSKNEDNKYYYYLDFDYSYKYNLFDANKFTKNSADATATKKYIKSGDDLAKYFVTDYFNYINYNSIYAMLGDVDFVTSYGSEIDTSVLTNPNTDNKITDALAQVTDYDDYFAGIVSVSDNIFSSGAVTTSYDKKKGIDSGKDEIDSSDIKKVLKETINTTIPEADRTYDVKFKVKGGTDQTVYSTLYGADENTTSTTKAQKSVAGSSEALSDEYEEHYNYMKWSLKDLYSNEAHVSDSINEAQLVKLIVKTKGADSLTPINNFFNYDQFRNTDQIYTASSYIDIKPSSLKLAPHYKAGSTTYDYSEYKIWVKECDPSDTRPDVHIECESPSENGVVNGIIITDGDVYFDKYSGEDAYKTVKEFNGLIVCGGKVYINNDVTNINSSEVCKKIMNAAIVKSQEYDSSDVNTQKEALNCIKVLKFFKDYSEYGDTVEQSYKDYKAGSGGAAVSTEQTLKDISTIDYSDVLRYNNWTRNVD